MLRNLTICLLGFTFFVCNLFFLANTSFATDDFVNEQYYGITSIKSGIVKLDNAEKEITDELKKEEVSAEEKETKGKMNVYFCGCYGDEWKQPVDEPVFEKCPICGLGTKATGCGNFLKTE